MEVLKELSDINTEWITLTSSKYWELLNKRVEAIVEKNHYYNIIKDALSTVENRLGNKVLPFHMSHGDFAPWNTYLVGEKLYLFDWEYSQDSALPGSDLFHFIIQTNFLLGKKDAGEVFKIIDEVIQSDLGNSYWNKLGIQNEDAISLFILYIVERVAFLVAQDGNKFNETSFFLRILTHFDSNQMEN